VDRRSPEVFFVFSFRIFFFLIRQVFVSIQLGKEEEESGRPWHPRAKNDINCSRRRLFRSIETREEEALVPGKNTNTPSGVRLTKCMCELPNRLD
jgi:hypothetical protein